MRDLLAPLDIEFMISPPFKPFDDLKTVPMFVAMGGGEEFGALNTQDALRVAPAVDALAKFCQRHRELAGEQFPIRDVVEVSLGGKTVRLDVSIPAMTRRRRPTKATTRGSSGNRASRRRKYGRAQENYEDEDHGADNE